MGRKLYIKDAQGREFTNREWAFSDTKVLAGILTYDAYLKTLEAQFQLNFRELNQVQLSKHIQGPGDEHWSYINSLLADIKELKRALRGTSNSNNAEFFEQLSHTAVEIVGNPLDSPSFTDPYFVDGSFFGDLEDLERLLYYLLHSGAKKVHLHCA